MSPDRQPEPREYNHACPSGYLVDMQRGEMKFYESFYCRKVATFCISRGAIRSAENAKKQEAERARNMERKCVDTIGTVLVPWACHFQC